MSNTPILDDTEDVTSGALDAPAAARSSPTLPERAEKRGFGAAFGSLFNRPGSSEALIAFGANMLSANSFGEGLGRGALAFSQTLREEEERRKPKQEFLADGAILASTDPMTGATSFEDVDPVQRFIAARDEAELRDKIALQDAKTEDQLGVLDARYEHMGRLQEDRLAEQARRQEEAFQRRMELMSAMQDRQDARSYGLAAYRASLDKGKDDTGRGSKLLDSRNAKEITGKADMADHLDRLVTSFKDEYAGNPATDSLANFIGKYTGKKIALDLPVLGKVELAEPEQAQFWQDYDDFKGMVRNDRFGATLTNNEKRDFEKITVTPGMDPDTIRRNLDRQRQIVMGALARRMRMAVAGGYNSEQILEAGGPAGLKALEAFPSVMKADKPAPRSREVTVPKAHIDFLIKNPNTAAQFDAKYGKGAAAAFIRKRKGQR